VTLIETYVGVAGGITKPEEVNMLRRAMPEYPFRRLAIGALVNEKTLHDEKETEKPNRYLDIHNLARIFQRDPLLINLIHLSLEDSRGLLSDLERLTMLGGPNLSGFQLNIKWPDPEKLNKFRIKWLETRRSQPWVILQICKEALDEIDNCSVALCRKLLDYNGCITDVLIDPSGGSGVLTDLGNLEKFVRAITFEHPGVGIGLAGGLWAENMKIVENLLWKFPNLSIGSGRILCNEDGAINLEHAAAFIKKVFTIQECFME
jgi:hypothetical protein